MVADGSIFGRNLVTNDGRGVEWRPLDDVFFSAMRARVHAVINVMIIFLALWPKDELEELKKSTRCPSLGFNRWFQQQLGEALIAHGVQMAKDELGDAEERAEQGLSPSFMPKDEQRKATGFEVYTFPVSHEEVKVIWKEDGKKVYLDGYATNNRCSRCYALAERDGQMGWYHDDGREDDYLVRKMPDGRRVPNSSYGCSVCKVYLCCKQCFRMEDNGKPLPDAWDHRAPTRGLLARRVVCE